MIRLGLAIVALGVAAGSLVHARPLTPAEGRYFSYSGELPECANQQVLSRIAGRFHQRETGYWKSGLQIDAFSNIRQTGLRSAGVDLIPRRYCTADAVMNDAKLRKVHYWVGENLGVIGWGWGVEWCIVGLDHHRAFGPACRAAGP